jgi:hypothetical protein
MSSGQMLNGNLVDFGDKVSPNGAKKRLRERFMAPASRVNKCGRVIAIQASGAAFTQDRAEDFTLVQAAGRTRVRAAVCHDAQR